MKSFYICKKKGLFKSYYSESEVDSSTKSEVGFTALLRYAKAFDTADAAKVFITDKSFENCFVINQFGQEVK